MTENERAHRFNASSIDELNGHRETWYGSTKNFALLLAVSPLCFFCCTCKSFGKSRRWDGCTGDGPPLLPAPARSAYCALGSPSPAAFC